MSGITDYVRVEPVADEDWPDAHRVVLAVDQQSFWIGMPMETKGEAQFLRNMLCIALKKIREAP